MKLARDFMLWHGFHKLEPFRVSSPIRESEWFEKPYREQVRMRAAVQWASRTGRLDNSDIIRKLTAHESDKIVSDSSPASASMDSPESSSPTTLDMPISHESTPKSTQSLSALTEFPQPPSQSPPVLTQLPPEPTPKPTIPLPLEPTPKPTIPLPLEPTPKPTIPLPLEPTAEPTISRLGQLTSKQKETLQKQMSRAKQLGVKTKQPAEKKTRKPKMEPKKEEPKLDKSPEKPSRPLTRDIVAKFWKFLGR
jgi:hypothetical protein